MNMFSIAGRGNDSLILQELQQLRRLQVQSILRVIDPYEKMCQTSAHIVKDLRAKYKKDISPCCIISGHRVESHLTLAHILPHSTDAHTQRIVGMVKKLDNFRNLMWLCSGLEVAFDQKQFSLEPANALTRTHFKVRIWEDDILEKPLYKGASENISSIVGITIDLSSFDKDSIPYRRCLSYHAMMCYFTHNDRFGVPRELPEAFEDISKESAGNGIIHQRNQYLEVYLSQSHREKLEEVEDDEEEDEDEGDDDNDGELLHQKTVFRSKANKKRTRRLSIQEFDGDLVHRKFFQSSDSKKRTGRRLSMQELRRKVRK
jgi:hypothetical protein